MQRLGGLQVGIAHILKVDGDKLRRADAGLGEFLPDQLQHDRLPAAADAGHDLNQLRPDERADTAHISFAFYHESQAPFPWLGVV